MVVALVFWIIFQNIEQNEKANLHFPAIQQPRPSTPAQQFPESGATIQYQQNSTPLANLTVISEQGRTENCVVKLDTWANGIPVIEIFVRAGERGETQQVPLGEYRVKIACGENWYGRENMFGRSSRISTGTAPLQFWQTGNTINGQILTLNKRIDGNFRTIDSYQERF
jgi:hypothetical protein